MFQLKENRVFWFNPNSFESGLNFELIGSILGLAIYNSDLLDIRFPKAVYKKLCNEKLQLEDLEEFEPALFNTLRNVGKMDAGIEDLEMTFSVSVDNFGAEEIVELKEGGKEIAVTQENKLEWVDLYLDYLLNKSIESQFGAFLRGFRLVMNGLAMQFFNHLELEKLICGKPELDMSELMENTHYANGFDKNHQTIK
jgi:hypothetical protein